MKVAFLIFVFFNTLIFAKTTVVVSIVPQKTFVNKIAKDMVDVTVMVEPGSSPHSYEPKSSQMIALSKADAYFSIGVEFENIWLDKFKSQNSKLKFIDISYGIQKIEMSEHNHHEEHGHDDHHEEHGHDDHHEEHGHDDHHEEHGHDDEHDKMDDPHTWTSPKNVELMAHNIYKALVGLDPDNKTFYKENLENFIKEIQATNNTIKESFKDLKPKSKFMVFHPSWGYFANDYNLVQIAVEVEGKSPKPKEMIKIIEEAKEENVQVIFTQPEFSDKSAKIIAKEAGINVVKISPLNGQWSENLIYMAKEIAKK